MSQKNEKVEPGKARNDVFKSRAPGWATMQSTSAFRAINFELFVRPVSLHTDRSHKYPETRTMTKLYSVL